MAYAILRFAKHKGGASKALSAHHERTKDSYASNPDIDLSRTAQNFHLVTPRWSYEQEIKHRIQTAGCRVRKDSVKFVDTLVTVSPEFAKAHEAEMPEYFRRAFDFLKERVGEENIFSAVVHMDETTPHMHLCFVPLTRDKRLSAKEILGNKKSMIRWQDDFYTLQLLKQLPLKNITARMLLHFSKVSVYICEFFHAQAKAAAPPSLLACLFV